MKRIPPHKGTSTWVSPIRNQDALRFIERMLEEQPRDLAMFVMGINTNLRACDLARIKAGQVRYLQPGDSFNLTEKKTGKKRHVTLNHKTHATLQPILRELSDDQYLFASRKGKGKNPMTTAAINRLVKGWCAKAKLKGNYGSHSLRKTWGLVKHRNGASIAQLMTAFNHSSQRETLLYIGIEEQEIKDLFMEEV